MTEIEIVSEYLLVEYSDVLLSWLPLGNLGEASQELGGTKYFCKLFNY